MNLKWYHKIWTQGHWGREADMPISVLTMGFLFKLFCYHNILLLNTSIYLSIYLTLLFRTIKWDFFLSFNCHFQFSEIFSEYIANYFCMLKFTFSVRRLNWNWACWVNYWITNYKLQLYHSNMTTQNNYFVTAIWQTHKQELYPYMLCNMVSFACKKMT